MHVARMWERKGAWRVLVGKPEVETPLGRPRRDRRITLRWIFKKWDGRGAWSGLIGLSIGTGGGLL